MATTQSSDKFQLVTDKLIQLLENGVKPWVKDWTYSGESAPRNMASGHVYTGINPILCNIDCLLLKDPRPYFIGFSQLKDFNWLLKKGSKSTWIFWGGTGKAEKENPDTGEIETHFYNARKWHNVFHCSLIDDSKSDVKVSDFVKRYETKTIANPDPKIDEIEEFLKATGANINHGGNQAYYTSSHDYIQLPKFEQFSSATGYYATALHELTHWTGHKTRCDRKLGNRFGSPDYAYEELIAELGAAYLCNDFSIHNEIENHASYLAGWLKALKNDKKFFFKAATQAKKAYLFLKPDK